MSWLSGHHGTVPTTQQCRGCRQFTDVLLNQRNQPEGRSGLVARCRCRGSWDPDSYPLGWSVSPSAFSASERCPLGHGRGRHNNCTRQLVQHIHQVLGTRQAFTWLTCSPFTMSLRNKLITLLFQPHKFRVYEYKPYLASLFSICNW